MTNADAPAPDPTGLPSPHGVIDLRLQGAIEDVLRDDDDDDDDDDDLAVTVACAEALNTLDEIGSERVTRYLYRRYVEQTR